MRPRGLEATPPETRTLAGVSSSTRSTCAPHSVASGASVAANSSVASTTLMPASLSTYSSSAGGCDSARGTATLPASHADHMAATYSGPGCAITPTRGPAFSAPASSLRAALRGGDEPAAAALAAAAAGEARCAARSPSARRPACSSSSPAIARPPQRAAGARNAAGRRRATQRRAHRRRRSGTTQPPARRMGRHRASARQLGARGRRRRSVIAVLRAPRATQSAGGPAGGVGTASGTHRSASREAPCRADNLHGCCSRARRRKRGFGRAQLFRRAPPASGARPWALPVRRQHCAHPPNALAAAAAYQH